MNEKIKYRALETYILILSMRKVTLNISGKEWVPRNDTGKISYSYEKNKNCIHTTHKNQFHISQGSKGKDKSLKLREKYIRIAFGLQDRE